MLVQFSVCPRREPCLDEKPMSESWFPDHGGRECSPESVTARVEGPWEHVMSMIRGCHQGMVADHSQVVTTIVVVEEGQAPPMGLKERILRDRSKFVVDLSANSSSQSQDEAKYLFLV